MKTVVKEERIIICCSTCCYYQAKTEESGIQRLVCNKYNWDVFARGKCGEWEQKQNT